MTAPNDRYLTVEALTALIEADEIDTVVLAFTDMQGRLQGKRLHGRYFLDVVLEHGTEGCNYLLAVDVDMNTVDGYAISSWERGYGDMEFVPDWDTLRRLTHVPGTAMVQCDLVWLDHAPVRQSPRTVLRDQLARVADGGWVALAGTELEFILFDTTYEEAHRQRYRDLTPANQYNVDYSILGTSRVEPLLRDIRNHMYAAGLDVESAKGECNLGQHEIGFLYADALTTADNHSVYKTAAKEIASQHGKAITFMAKYDEREGNSCHIHLSLRGEDGDDRSSGATARAPRSTTTSSPVSWRRCATSRCSTRPTSTPTSASRPGSFAPTAVAWGLDNRTCAVRLVGHGAGARMENRVPGGDVNPYLALAAMLAGGLHGIEQELPLEEELVGNAYASDTPARADHAAGGARPVPRLGGRAGRLRRRRRRPLRQHGRRRARGLRRGGHRLGAVPRLREDVTGGHPHRCESPRCPPYRRQPGHRGPDRRGPLPHRRGDRRRRSSGPTRRSPPGGTCRPASAPGCCAAFAAVVDEHVEELARLEVANSGHTIGNARWEAGNVRDCLNYYSAAPERLFGRQIPVAGGLDVTFHEPLGVVGVIVPWNFPMPIAGWGFAPALAAGNTVVLKPAELTPLTAIRLGELALEAGLPEGVLTVLPGKGSVVGRALRHAPAGAQGRLHRLDRGRQADHGRLRRAGEAGDPRARRQERQHRLRRRRRGAGGRQCAVRRLRQRRPGLLRAVADPGPAAGRTTSSSAASRRPWRSSRWPTPATKPARWAR